MKKMLRKSLLFVLAAVLALGTISALSGCGKSDEEIIRAGLQDGFGSLKDTSSELFKKTSTAAQQSLSSQGIQIDNFMEMWLEGYDYQIGDITVDGSTAAASITITCKQLGPILDGVVSEIQNSGKEFTTTEEATAAVSELLGEKIKTAPTTTTTVTVNCTLSGREWQFSDDLQNNALMPALYGSSKYA